jgi:hypothetical protein
MKKLAFASLAALSLLAACGDSGGPSSSTPKAFAYAGTFGSAANSGTIIFSTAPVAIRAGNGNTASLSAPIDLIGTLTFSNGSTLDLTGTLDGAALLLAGTGYQFTGTLSNGVISGSFTGPNGESGSFSASLSSSGGAVALYCGSYTGDDEGVFSLALKPDRTGGVIVVPSSGSGGLTGRSRPTPGTTDQIDVLPDAAPTVVIATGALFGIPNTAFDSVDGFWDDGQGSSGTFGGSTRCQ